MLKTNKKISILYFPKISVIILHHKYELMVIEPACISTRFSSYTNASKYYFWMKNKQILTSSISKKLKCRFLGCDGKNEHFISEYTIGYKSKHYMAEICFRL